MPYEIIESSMKGKKGYRVKKEGTREYFSKEPLTLKQAKAQRTAIIISETKKKDLKNMTKGGIVPTNKIKHVPKNKNDWGDVIPVTVGGQPLILEPSELVIPVQHAKKVMRFLRAENIKLPGM